MIEEYPRSQVAVIEFHEHIPGPDPMTNPDAVERMGFYTRSVIRGTPTVIMDGTGVDVGGGGESRAPNKLEKYKEMLGTALKAAPSVGLGLQGSRRGNTVTATTTVVWRDTTGREGHDLRLRVALVEREVDYTGGNGLERHAMVFRGFLTGQEGTVLTAGTDARSLKNTVDIATLEKTYGEYLDGYLAENPDRFSRSDGTWRAMMNEIDASDLALVAFVQDDTTKEVLQARVVDLK
jgi:hypothetical protein